MRVVFAVEWRVVRHAGCTACFPYIVRDTVFSIQRKLQYGQAQLLPEIEKPAGHFWIDAAEKKGNKFFVVTQKGKSGNTPGTRRDGRSGDGEES